MRGAACNQARYFQARVARWAPRACARHSPANRSRSADKRQAQAARQAAQRKLAESGGVYDAAPWATDREKKYARHPGSRPRSAAIRRRSPAYALRFPKNRHAASAALSRRLSPPCQIQFPARVALRARNARASQTGQGARTRFLRRAALDGKALQNVARAFQAHAAERSTDVRRA